MGRRLAAGLIATLAVAPAARAQDLESEAASAAASVAGVSADSTEIKSFWQLVAKVPGAVKKCKKKICKSCVGKLINEITQPISMITGGCLECCPQGPAAGDPEAPGAAGAAAALAQCLASAPERIEAVRFLATADCGRFPEAEKELIEALRNDCSECVRFEAAKAFATGCCCTEKSIKALREAASGGTGDGSPAERSHRVRSAAAYALGLCEATYVPPPPEKPEAPERPESPDPPAGGAAPIPPVPPPGGGPRSVAFRPDDPLISAELQPVPVYASEPIAGPLEPSSIHPDPRSVAAAKLRRQRGNQPAFAGNEPVRRSRSLGEAIFRSFRRDRTPEIPPSSTFDAAEPAEAERVPGLFTPRRGRAR